MADVPVTGFEDLRNEEGWLGPFKGATDRAARNFLLFTLGDSARIALRPSGTEPKAKFYVEACSPPRSALLSDSAWQDGCEAVDRRVHELAEAFAPVPCRPRVRPKSAPEKIKNGGHHVRTRIHWRR